jgi:periodic tryptophan protein 2
LEKALEKTETEKKNSEKTLLDNDQNLEKNQVRTTRSKDKIDNKDVKKLMYKRLGKHYLADEVHKSDRLAVLTAAAYHQDTRILVLGFSNGAFFLYEMPEVNMIHSLRYYN